MTDEERRDIRVKLDKALFDSWLNERKQLLARREAAQPAMLVRGPWSRGRQDPRPPELARSFQRSAPPAIP
jgi:hypothetical protein